jgi:hypothetical protein
MTAVDRELSEALFAALRSVLGQIRETEPVDLDRVGRLDEGDLPAVLESLRSLRECCSARALLYVQAAEILDRQEALWKSRRQQGRA